MFIKNQKGLVILESLPIVWVMFVLMGATLGSWGIVHTAVLNSIAARNYTFFLFNNRADLSYLRDFSNEEYSSTALAADFGKRYYRNDGKRFSYINQEGRINVNEVYATRRRITFGDNLQSNINNNNIGTFLSRSDHNSRYSQVSHGRNKKKVKNAWIMVGYGICLCAACDNSCN